MGVMQWWVGEEDAQESEDELIATRRLTFFMSSVQDSFFEVLSDPACPRKYDRHPDDRRLFLVRISPEQRDTAFRIWDIDLEYSSNPKRRDDQENPLNEPCKFEWDTTEESETIEFDANGNPLINAAGDLIEGIEEVTSHWVIRFTKNVAKVPRFLLDYDLAVNNGAVRIQGLTFPKETLWLRRLRISDVKFQNDIAYFELSGELHFKSGTWIRTFANRGYSEIDKEVVIIGGVTQYDADGNPRLDASGNVIQEGGIVITRREKKRILVGTPAEPPADPQWLDEEGRRPREIIKVPRVISPTFTVYDEVEQVKEILDPEDFVFVSYRTKKLRNFGVLPLK